MLNIPENFLWKALTYPDFQYDLHFSQGVPLPAYRKTSNYNSFKGGMGILICMCSGVAS